MALLGAAVSCFCCFGLFQVAKNSSFRSHHICETGYCNYTERLSCLIIINQVEFQLICWLENNKSPHISKTKTNTLILNFSRVYLCIKMLIQYKLKFSLYQINFTCVTNQLPLVSKRLCIEMTLYQNDFVSKWLCIKMTRHPSLNHTLSPPGFKKWSPARRISWLLNKFPLSTLWDVSRIVRRICKLMLGCEGSKYFFSRL